jgi:hypothetical protein
VGQVREDGDVVGDLATRSRARPWEVVSTIGASLPAATMARRVCCSCGASGVVTCSGLALRSPDLEPAVVIRPSRCRCLQHGRGQERRRGLAVRAGDADDAQLAARVAVPPGGGRRPGRGGRRRPRSAAGPRRRRAAPRSTAAAPRATAAADEVVAVGVGPAPRRRRTGRTTRRVEVTPRIGRSDRRVPPGLARRSELGRRPPGRIAAQPAPASSRSISSPSGRGAGARPRDQARQRRPRAAVTRRAPRARRASLRLRLAGACGRPRTFRMPWRQAPIRSCQTWALSKARRPAGSSTRSQAPT